MCFTMMKGAQHRRCGGIRSRPNVLQHAMHSLKIVDGYVSNAYNLCFLSDKTSVTHCVWLHTVKKRTNKMKIAY